MFNDQKKDCKKMKPLKSKINSEDNNPMLTRNLKRNCKKIISEIRNKNSMIK